MTMSQKGRKKTVCLASKSCDCFGLWELEVVIDSKLYSYTINSEFAVRKFESLVRRHKPGSAIHLLNLFKVQEVECGNRA